MIASTFFIVILLRDRVAPRGPQAARRFFDSIRTNHADAMAADFRGDGVPTVDGFASWSIAALRDELRYGRARRGRNAAKCTVNMPLRLDPSPSPSNGGGGSFAWTSLEC